MSLALLAGCASYRPEIPVSKGHIDKETVAPKPDVAPPPVARGAYVPPPKPAVKQPTYSVVVNDVPVKELLFALARDSKQNIDIHPGITGKVTLNAVNETLPAILDRIARQVDMRYHQEGNTLIVEQDTPFMKTYRVNYVNLSRATTSTSSVATQISSTSGSGTQTAGAQGSPVAGGTGNASNTTVTSKSSNDFWDVLAQNVRNILASTQAQKLSSEERIARLDQIKAAQAERLQQATAVSGAGASAANLFSTAFPTPLPVPGDPKDDIVINPVAGTVSILATGRQQALVQQYLDSVTASVQRQVLIEATIVEVRLSDTYQAGVDFSRLAINGGLNVTQSLTQGTLLSPPNLAIGYINPTSAIGNIAAAVRLLEQFGNARVLSSPKLMALNNQTALLKVVDNRVFFNVQAETVTNQTTATTTFNTTINTVPVGLVMFVTPQIDENGSVMLNVRPTVSRITSFVRDPNPSLAAANVTNLIPEIQAREMESVLRVGSGQTVVLGGLMQDDVRRNRDGVPVLSQQPVIGDVFSFRDEAVVKSELIIFLRPVVVANPSLESEELKSLQRFLPSSSSAKDVQ
ncbi:MAG: secretin N-terminal domain-containing protein [Burkholderiales bacterium]